MATIEWSTTEKLGDKGKIAFKYLALNPASIGAKRHEASNDITTLVSRGGPIDGVELCLSHNRPKVSSR